MWFNSMIREDERIRTEVETPLLAIAVCEVLHGCRQLVP